MNLVGAVRRPGVLEGVAVGVLTAAVLVVHDIGQAFHHSFWNDEAWVAVTTRYPLSDLRVTTSSTPIGWSFLLRLVPWGGPERLRLVPLLFLAAAVVLAWRLARTLPWPSRLPAVGAGLTAAYATLMTPSMLVRNDLKQYTADAAVVLGLFLATSRLEREWSRRNLAVLAAGAPVGMLFSHAAAFAGVAILGAVVAVQLVRRDWRRTLESLAASVAAAVAMLVVYEAFDSPAVVPGLTQYWRHAYLPTDRGFGGVTDFFRAQWKLSATYFGLGPAWLALLLVVAGVVTVFRLRRPVTALAVPVLALEMVVLSAAKKYPLLDPRTSTFLCVLAAVLAAIGVAGIATLLDARVRRWAAGRPAGRPAGIVAAVVAIVVAAGLFTAHAQKYVRWDLPADRMKPQITYVDRHSAPSDAVVVNASGAMSFAYYWTHDRPAVLRSDVNLQRYLPAYPRQPRIAIATGYAPADVAAALQRAVAWAAEHPGARIWLIERKRPSEVHVWLAALRAAGLHEVHVGNGVYLDPLSAGQTR